MNVIKVVFIDNRLALKYGPEMRPLLELASPPRTVPTSNVLVKDKTFVRCSVIPSHGTLSKKASLGVSKKYIKDVNDEMIGIRLLLVDDQPTVRRGLAMRLALEPDILVVGEASNGEEALVLAQACSPDVVLMDVEMPKMDGVAATQALRKSMPTSAVVIMSIHDDTATRTRALAAGAFAFLGKNGATEMLLTTIRQAAQQAL